MNNPKMDAKLTELLEKINSELIGALAQRAQLDETIARGRAMLQVLTEIKNAPTL